MNDIPLVSIVIPCHNERDNVVEMHRRISSLAASRSDVAFEFIYVDDGSYDDTLIRLKELATADPRILALSLSRNFGHQLAVTAGIDHAQGNAVVLIDADLQDPPEVIAEMIDQWKKGFQVIYGVRTDRQGESRFKLLTAYLFYRFLNALSDIPIPLDTGDFRLMDRRVCEVLREMPERDRFLRGLVSWTGFRQTPLEYRRAARHSGTTKYPLKKMIRFASDGMISFSVRPLRLATMLGMVSAGIASLGILWVLVGRFAFNNLIPGWAAIIIAILFFGGLQLLCTGILGEYIGRIYMQSKGRPLYVVSQQFGAISGNRNITQTEAYFS